MQIFCVFKYSVLLCLGIKIVLEVDFYYLFIFINVCSLFDIFWNDGTVGCGPPAQWLWFSHSLIRSALHPHQWPSNCIQVKQKWLENEKQLYFWAVWFYCTCTPKGQKKMLLTADSRKVYYQCFTMSRKIKYMINLLVIWINLWLYLPPEMDLYYSPGFATKRTNRWQRPKRAVCHYG